MSLSLNRWVYSGEHIHHIDGNKENNEIGNLEIVSNSSHAKKHIVEINKRRGYKERKYHSCENCGTKTLNDKYCSYVCANIASRRCCRPNRDELKILIDKHPMTKIGNMFGVSDNAVRKWARSYKIL